MPAPTRALARQPIPPAPRAFFAQPFLFCSSCGAPPAVGRFCRRCYRQAWHSRQRFGGNRERALLRDGHKCRACGFDQDPVLHHRRPGEHAGWLLITLCRGCHARVHRLAALRGWLPPLLASLWEEQHPGVPLQEQFPWGEGTG